MIAGVRAFVALRLTGPRGFSCRSIHCIFQARSRTR
jgi:hypothetical protein